MRDVTLGIVVGLLIAGCAGFSFSYKHYGLELAKYEGKLLGPEPAQDEDFAKCAGNNCVVMFRDDFFAMKQDYIDTKNKLDACERGLNGITR